MEKLKILLLCHRPVARNAQTIDDHIWSFRTFSRHHVVVVSFFGDLPSEIDIDRFDAVVLHYTVAAARDENLSAAARERIARFRGLKAQFIQDEYRFVNATLETTRRLGIDVLFTCVPEGEIEKVYSSAALPGTRKIPVLTGYVPEQLARLAVPPIAARPIHVGYRARKLPYWLGELGVEKWRIAEGFVAAAKESGLALDISSTEDGRLYGKKWVSFLTSCRAVLGVESGASVFDFTGAIQRDTEAYLESHPNAGFPEVQAKVFAAEEGKIRLNQISPRCFESAALRTAMVLFEGEYSGVLAPWTHYIPLRKDFRNMAEVMQRLRDTEYLQSLADRAHEDIACNPAYSYAGFIGCFDKVMDEEFARRMAPRREMTASAASAIRWRVATPALLAWLRARDYLAHWTLHAQMRLYQVWIRLPERWQRVLRRHTGSLRERLSSRLRMPR